MLRTCLTSLRQPIWRLRERQNKLEEPGVTMKTIYSATTLLGLMLILFFSTLTASAYYDPAMQRWLNRDPLGETGFEALGTERWNSLPSDSANCYVFLRNNPVSFVDLSGLAVNDPPPCAPYPECDYPKPPPSTPPSCPSYETCANNCKIQVAERNIACLVGLLGSLLDEQEIRGLIYYKRCTDHAQREFEKCLADCNKLPLPRGQ